LIDTNNRGGLETSKVFIENQLCITKALWQKSKFYSKTQFLN